MTSFAGKFFYIKNDLVFNTISYLANENTKIRLTTHTNSSKKAGCENAVCFLYVPELLHSLLHNTMEWISEKSEYDGICLIKII